MKGKLYLIPTPIFDNTLERVIPKINLEILNSIQYYIVEDVRTARRFLVKTKISRSIDELTFFVLNKHTNKNDLPDFLNPITRGNNVGLLSEAGIPCVADPGSIIVDMAHRRNIKVVPLVGPSSIFLALMASGLNGQNFAFNGYLPINKNKKIKTLKILEKRSAMENQTQIFIETPYRNNHLFDDIIKICNPKTKLCIASELTSDKEYIQTKSVDEWKKSKIDLNKKPTIFLLYAGSKGS